jgi:outer membrane receptor protein involved in Fe transport
MKGAKMGAQRAKQIRRLLLASVAAVSAAGAAMAQDMAKTFHVEAQPANTGIPEFAQEADVQILVPAEAVRGKTVHAVQGSLAVRVALAQLLADTGLVVDSDDGKTIVLKAQLPKNAAAPVEGAIRAEPIETVVVTGTNIRGGVNPSVPISSYTRDDIDLSGTGSVQQFLKRMPENFGGGASDETVSTLAGGGNAVNAVNGAGVNLRGLGSDSTLVLIDGHRIAPANNSGNFVDMSMIPLSVLSRVDVLPDGASAIYGSDAVGGVVNLVLRNDFDGQETRARYGTTSDGGGQEEEAAQTVGRTWSGGSGLITYDYDYRAPINSSDRDYASSNPNPFTLIPKQQKNSLFASANQALADNIQLFGEALWSHRSSATDVTYAGIGNQHDTVGAENYGGTAGVTIGLGGDRELEVSSTYDASKTNQAGTFLGAPSTHVHTNTTVVTADAKLDGTLFTWNAGAVRFAIGGQYRHETFDSKDLLAGSVYSPNRGIEAGFAELDIPLLGQDQPIGPVDLNLAGRLEHYSDFGSTGNPKFGLSWRPIEDLKLRATYGTSFRAPLLNDLNPIPFQAVALPEFDPATSGFSNVLIVFGGNPDLKPEKSTNWTLGADFTPATLPGLRASTTYYNIHFTNLITTAQTAGFDLFNGLDNASAFGPLLQRNPSLAEVTGFVSHAQEFDDFTGIPGGVNLSTISALIDSRSTNLSVLNTDGIDFKVSYDADVPFGHIEAGLDGTYILNFKEQVAPTAATMSVLNTQYNPVDLKLRGRLLVSDGNFEGALFVNYVDSYRDVRTSPSIPISSWTTFDLGLQYNFQGNGGLLDGLTGSFNIVNIFDKSPPFVATPAPGLAPGLVFDGANANVWGREISLQLTERW